MFSFKIALSCIFFAILTFDCIQADDSCQKNFGRRLKAEAMSFAELLYNATGTLTGNGAGPCCNNCVQNPDCNFFYQEQLSFTQVNCFLYQFRNIPDDFIEKILTGQYFDKDSNGNDLVDLHGAFGFTNSFLGI